MLRYTRPFMRDADAFAVLAKGQELDPGGLQRPAYRVERAGPRINHTLFPSGLAGGPHETLPEEGRLVIPWSIARLALTLGGNCFRARQRRHGDEDDAGPVLKMCAAEEQWCAAPRELDLSVQGIPKIWASRRSRRGNKITPLCFVS
jgi:hypothetical protein